MESGQRTIHDERRDGYLLSSDPALIDFEWVYAELSVKAYWAQGRPRETQARAMANSQSFGIYALDAQGKPQHQVAFARLVTDYTYFGWLADVWVAEAERGKGLGKWLVAGILRHPDVAALSRVLLATVDAHGLYTGEAGFAPISSPERFLMRVRRHGA